LAAAEKALPCAFSTRRVRYAPELGFVESSMCALDSRRAIHGLRQQVFFNTLSKGNKGNARRKNP